MLATYRATAPEVEIVEDDLDDAIVYVRHEGQLPEAVPIHVWRAFIERERLRLNRHDRERRLRVATG